MGSSISPVKLPNFGRKNRTDFANLRRKMVANQVEARGICDPRVLDAMLTIERHQFVSKKQQSEAYQDWPLPIGFGQTISQPFTVAFMAEALQLQGPEKVLEIGMGSGYGAAVLSLLCREVHTVERIPELADQARQRLSKLGFDNVFAYASDGTLGLADQGPFDGIVVTAGSDAIPKPLAEQLAEGGRLVIPVGSTRTQQNLCRLTRQDDDWVEENLGRFAFVPLIGQYGWQDHVSKKR